MDLLARVATECPNNEQWYACSKNGFRGCCSVDPCSSGICPDRDDAVQTTLSTLSTAQATVSSKRAPTTGATSPIAGTTTSPSTTSQGTITSGIVVRSTTQALASPSATPSAGSKNDSGALIGGIVGGILALLLLIALILFLVYRSRKKRGKQFTLLRWGSSAEKVERRIFSQRGRGRFPRSDSSSGDISLDVPISKPTPSHPGYIPQLLLPGPISTSTPANNLTVNQSSRAPHPYTLRIPSARSSLTTHPPSPPSSVYSTPSMPSVSSLRPAPLNPLRADTTPELPDTGFYRQRAELAAYSQSELINIPPERRRRPVPLHQHQDADENTHQPGFAPTPTPTPALPSITTADGVVLGANFDRRLPGDDPYPRDSSGNSNSDGNSDGNSDAHVLSLVNYPARDSILPAYQEEWRKSYVSGKGV